MATVYAAPDEPVWKYQDSSEYPKELYQFSSDTNTIIIILDSYQSDIFQEIINEDEKYRDMFDGFTYYRNRSVDFPRRILLYPSSFLENTMIIRCQ